MQRWLNKFDKWLVVSPKKKEDAQRQADYLIESLVTKLKEDNNVTYRNYHIGGSFALGTSIRKTESTPLDIDVHFYVTPSKDYDASNLRRLFSRKIREIYPTKEGEDFEVKESPVKITFSGSGLKLDVVPVVPCNLPKDRLQHIRRGYDKKWGYLPRPGNKRKYTSAFSQTKWARYMIDNASESIRPDRMIRVMKWWSKQHNPKKKANSFFIQCRVLRAYEKKNISNNWSEALLQMFQFFDNWSVFENETDSKEDPRYNYFFNKGNRVYTLDPIDNRNNLTESWTMETLKRFRNKAKESHEHLKGAINDYNAGDKESAIYSLEKIFGSQFSEAL